MSAAHPCECLALKSALGLGLDPDFSETDPLGIEPGGVGFWLDV